VPKVEVDLSAACAARPDDGVPGVVQDVGQADQHQGAAGVAGGETEFEQARFSGPALFTGAQFHSRTRFTGVRFHSAIRFRSSQSDDIAFLHARAFVAPNIEHTWPPGWTLKPSAPDEEGQLDDKEGTWGLLTPFSGEAETQTADIPSH
jgi:hypothetical protein